MSSYNKVILLGNLTRDPELKQLNSGQSLCKLGLATNRQLKSRDGGEGAQEVCFVDVDVWGAQAENCNKFLTKGSSVLLEGRLKLDSWTDNEGNKKNKHSIVAERVTFVRGNSNEASSGAASYQKPSTRSTGIKNEQAFKDELPF